MCKSARKCERKNGIVSKNSFNIFQKKCGDYVFLFPYYQKLFHRKE